MQVDLQLDFYCRLPLAYNIIVKPDLPHYFRNTSCGVGVSSKMEISTSYIMANQILFRLLMIFSLALATNGMFRAVASAEDNLQQTDIQQWIADLDSDLYLTRENAQSKLEEAGVEALDAVTLESQVGSLESATRAINILLFWSESKDRSIRMAALEKLIQLPNRPKESAIAKELLADAREEEALEAIVAMGGDHTLQPRNLSGRFIGQQMAPQVFIGKDWTGGVEGLKHLAAVRRASIVSFHSAPIDDRAIDMLLDLRSVRRFEFYGTKNVSEEATNKLRQRFPGNQVDVRSGARLGIQGEFGTAKVINVVEGSAADKAGLKKNDQIVEFEGEKVQDFSVLTSRIAKKEPGDSVELTVVRSREVMKITVTFDTWGDSKIQLKGQAPEKKPGETKKEPRPATPFTPSIKLDRR